MTAGPDPSTDELHRRDEPVSSSSAWRFVPVTLLMPVLAATVGLDGGPIFQIVAVERCAAAAERTAALLWARQRPRSITARCVTPVLLCVANAWSQQSTTGRSATCPRRHVPDQLPAACSG